MDDLEFMTLVQQGRVAQFGHRDHLRLAFAAARAGETAAEVVEHCRIGIQAVAAAHGAPDRYDEAITAAWAERMLRLVAALPGASFDEILAANPQLEDAGHLDSGGVALAPVTRREPGP